MARGMIRGPPRCRPRAQASTEVGAERGAGGERGGKAPSTRKQSSTTPAPEQPPRPPQPPLQPPPSRRDLLATTTGLVATAAAFSNSASFLLARPASAASKSAAAEAAAKTAAAAAAASSSTPAAATAAGLPSPTSYSLPGPYAVARLPLLEHVCPRLSPACVGKQCAVTIEILVPRLLPGESESGGGGGREEDKDGEEAAAEGGGRPRRRGTSSNSSSSRTTAHVAPPRRAPLAILSGGFLVGRGAYASTARHLCSWGFAVASYDKTETALDPLDDVVSAAVVLEVADFVASSAALSALIDARRLYLVGHSRGGKLSVLAAARDGEGAGGGGGGSGEDSSSGGGGGGGGGGAGSSGPPPPSPSPSPSSSSSSSRVKALGLIDPVNNTVYAPQGPRFPSATAALRGVPALAATPLLAVASGPLVSGRDCAPADAAAPSFFEACRQAPAWLVELRPAGHFQFLDEQSAVQRAVCASGPVEDEAVRASARAALAAWGRLAVFGDGGGSAGGGGGGEGGSGGGGEKEALSLLERTERDIEELLRDGMTRGGGGGEYTKKLREPPLLSTQKKHISFS